LQGGRELLSWQKKLSSTVSNRKRHRRFLFEKGRGEEGMSIGKEEAPFCEERGSTRFSAWELLGRRGG